MKRVLLTGASGFVGRACVAPLLALGYEIHTILRTPGEVPDGVRVHHGDLLDPRLTEKQVAAIRPTHLLHAAWAPWRGDSWGSADNLTWLAASAAMLRAFVLAGGERAVGLGSAGGEATLLGAAQLALAGVFAAVAHERLNSGVSSAWGRLFMVYGPGAGGEFAGVARAVASGAGGLVRDLIYVDDAGAALARLLDSGVAGTVDIGTGQGVTLGQVAAALGNDGRATDGPGCLAAPAALVADPARLRGEVGFIPAITLAEGLERLAAAAPAGAWGLVGEIDAEIGAAAQIYQPSKFWLMLQERNRNQIAKAALFQFKRTINNNYFHWLPGDYNDNQMRNLVRFWIAHQSTVPLAAVAESSGLVSWDGVAGFGGDNPFQNPHYRSFYAFFVGLLWNFAAAHDPLRLFERIEEPALGSPLPVYADGRLISQDLANSLHEWSRVRQMVQGLGLPQTPRIMELGAGYGRLAYVFLQAEPCRYVIVDIAPALAVAQWYLTAVFPGRRIFGFRHFNDYAEVAAEFLAADICFLSANQLAMLPAGVIDITVSISSLHEMRADQIAHFKALIAARTGFAVYFKQWMRWRNPEDEIEVGRADFMLGAPWRLVMDTPHAVHDEFCELGFLRAPL